MSREFRMKLSSWGLVLASIPILVLFGCTSTTTTTPATTTTTTPVPPPPPPEWGAKMDVRVVSVKPPGGSSDANFDPATIKVRKRMQIVVWVLEVEGSLQIQFANSPFPAPPICEGRFCVALKPPGAEKPSGLYPYTATVTVAGQTTSADPNVEVVD